MGTGFWTPPRSSWPHPAPPAWHRRAKIPSPHSCGASGGYLGWGGGKTGVQSLTPQLLATDGAISRGGRLWPWACGAGGQAGLNPGSPGKTWATSCHLGPPHPAAHRPARRVPRCRASGCPGPPTPRCSVQGIPRCCARGRQSRGLLGDRGHHQSHAGSPGGTRPPHPPSVGPSRPLRARDEQANPILIPDYVPREPLPEAGCCVAIGAGGTGMDPPTQEL